MEITKKLLRSHPCLLVIRIFMVYAAMAVCRLVFALYNSDAVGTFAPGELWPLVKGSLLFDSVSVVYAYGLFIVLSLLPFRFRELGTYRMLLFWYYAIVTFVVLALNMTDVVYFHYAQIRLTAADMIFAGNDNNMPLFFRFVFDNWHLVLLWLALTASLIWIYRKLGDPESPLVNRVFYPVNTVILVAAVLLSVAMARGGGLGREIRPVAMNNAMQYTSSPARANMILSNPFCILRTAGGGGSGYGEFYIGKDGCGDFSPYHYPAERSVSALPTQKNKNIVIFVLESFSAEHSALLNPDLYAEGGGYTPFLDSLMREGYYFTRAYSNGRKSIDALPAIVASTPSFFKPFVLLPGSLGPGRQLPRLLGEQGYSTMFFCGSSEGSMGFGAYANQSGFTEMYWKEDYDSHYPGNKDNDGYWGIYDEPFIGFMGEILSAGVQPFLATVFTLSSHHPFILPVDVAEGLPEGITKVQRPVAYTDRSIRRFYERFGKEEWFNNTLFVFVADHVSSERHAPWSESTSERHHIITFFHTPDGSLRGTDDSVFQQVDIMPTLLGLLDFPEAYFGFGRDIFREPHRPAVAYNYFNNFQVITDSLTVLFDENGITAAYSARDRLQQENIADPADPAQRDLANWMRGVIREYDTHLKAKDFTVPGWDTTRYEQESDSSRKVWVLKE